MPGFDELVSTEPERDALNRLREATRVVDGPMERHCLRVRQIAARIAGARGWVIDGEVLTVASILHDIGLYRAVATSGRPYVADGAALAREMLNGYGWAPRRVELCAEAIDRHHDLRSQVEAGYEVEVLRRADLVDLSGGLVPLGVPRAWLRGLFAEVPRHGMYREIGRELLRALRERPTTLPQIFWRR